MRWRLAVVLALGFAAAPVAGAALQSTQANIHFNLALRQYQGQKLDDAKGTLAKALSLVPEHPQANLLSGLIACEQSRFKDAIAPLNIAAKGLPDNPDVHNNLGVAYFQLGRLDDAQAAWQKVLDLQPARHDVAMNLGTLALRRKDPAAAQAAFAKVTKAEPGNARAWTALAEAADAAGDKAAAAEARLKALDLQPGDKSLRLQTGERLYQAGKLSQAAKVLEPMRDQGEATAEFLLGVLAYRQGRFEDSRERFEAALKARPDYPEARFNLAITFYDQGRFPQALAQFQAVLDRNPKDVEARKNLDVTRQAAVRAHLKDGSQDFLKADYAAALGRWRQALELEPGNRVVKDLVETAEAQLKLQAEELSAAGQAAWAAGKKEDAILAFARALERDPANAAAKAGLESAKDEAQRLVQAYRSEADADLREGRLNRARSQVEKVKALDPAAGKKLAALVEKEAQALYQAAVKQAQDASRRGDLTEQVDAWQKAVDARPEDARARESLNLAKVAWREAYNAAGDAAEKAEKAGQRAEAIKQYQRLLELQPTHAAAKDALKRLRPAVKAKAAVDAAQLDEWYYQGVYAYAGGDVVKAEDLWKKVLAGQPQHRLAKEALDRAQRRQKD
jgi:tetratricopeptide (TPR) repeat protein